MSKPRIVLRTLLYPLRYVPAIIAILISVPVVGMWAVEGAKFLGLRAVPVPVVGTGSMYPSLFWSKGEGGPEDESKKVIEEYRSTPRLFRYFEGFQLFGRTYLARTIQFGDMVAFANDRTVSILEEEKQDTSVGLPAQVGFIKRVIGVPGDTIELRDGFVYRNGELLSEPYTATPRGSYGGSSLADCQVLTVPEGHYFVLGDNRKVSSDSRFELGLVQEKDVEYTLPLFEQGLYQSLWRDTSTDQELLGEPTLHADEFVKLVNLARLEHQVKPLALKSSLSRSSTLRGERLLQNQDTTFDMQVAVASAGYSNIILGEFVSYGHFSAQELLENLLFQSATAKQLMNGDFSDLGVTAVNRIVDGCPRQVIVGHLGGYVPAKYESTTVESWRGLRDNLRSILPSWEYAQEYKGIDQEKLSQLLGILRRRLALAQEILETMEQKKWFTDDQKKRIQADDEEAKQAEILAQELNKE